MGTTDSAKAPEFQPAGPILAYLEQYVPASPWAPTGHGCGTGWMTTTTLIALLTNGRVKMTAFCGHFFLGQLDGVTVSYTHTLFGIIDPNQAEITADQPCPDMCPVCSFDLASDGYPTAHQSDPDGAQCAFTWGSGTC